VKNPKQKRRKTLFWGKKIFISAFFALNLCALHNTPRPREEKAWRATFFLFSARDARMNLAKICRRKTKGERYGRAKNVFKNNHRQRPFYGLAPHGTGAVFPSGYEGG
jgi:hypothetical protein